MPAFSRAHPFTIIDNLRRVFFLIVIPVLRGLVSALRGGLTGWLRGAWIDMLVLLLMLGIAALSWLCVSFRCTGSEIELRAGILSRRKVFIPWENVTTVTLAGLFYLRPLRALRFRADTPGGSFGDADFTILLSNRQAGEIKQSRAAFSGGALGTVYQPTTGSIAALSLLTSNSFSGILFIATFISQSGKLLGREFPDMLIGTFEQAARSLAFGIPPAAAAIGYILIAGWLIGFVLSFVRYKNFTLTRRPGTLCISGGMFTHREYFIRYKEINFIDIRQSMATKLLRLHSLYVSAVGYGKQKDDISCIIPTETAAEFEGNRGQLFPSLVPGQRGFAPNSRAIMRFLGQPLICLSGILAALYIFLWLFPSWDSLIWFAGLMAAVPALVFLAVGVVDFKTCGVSFCDGNYTMRYSNGFSLHTVVIPEDKVVGIELRQSFFQKFGAYCDLIICTKAERRQAHRCRGLVMAELLGMFDLQVHNGKRP